MRSERRYLGRLRSVAAGILLLIACLAIAAPWFAPADPLALDIDARLQPPSWSALLGTDAFGRDVLSRMLYGAGVSLRLSGLSVLIACVAGLILGCVAGYFGGIVDRIISIVIEAFLILPAILLALALIAILGPGEFGVVTALAVAFTPSVARMVRGSAILLREREFVQAARSMDLPHAYIIARHIVPNVMTPLIVLATVFFAQALLSESALSFLGLGVPPPYPSWGGILAESRAMMDDAPWLSIAPGLAIAITLLCINLVGDALRDAFDPHH